jgi:hypothetical protein
MQKKQKCLNSFAIVKKTFLKEGVKVFYSGIVPCLIGSGGIVALEFSISEFLEKKFTLVN